jgi:hypothetical protein
MIFSVHCTYYIIEAGRTHWHCAALGHALQNKRGVGVVQFQLVVVGVALAARRAGELRLCGGEVTVALGVCQQALMATRENLVVAAGKSVDVRRLSSSGQQKTWRASHVSEEPEPDGILALW